MAGGSILFSGCPWCHDSVIPTSFLLSTLRTNWWNLTKFAYALILTRSRLGLIRISFHQIVTRIMALYDPWFLSDFRSRSISWERIDRVWSNFAYALILTRSRLGLLLVNFHQTVTELWPLMSLDLLCIYIDIDNIYVKIVTHQFLSNSNRINCPCQNSVSSQYLENELMEFDQLLHMHWYYKV